MSFERRFARMAKASAKVVKRSALAIAKSNRRKIKNLTEVHQGITSNMETAFNATPIVTFLIPVGEGEKTQMTHVTLKGIIKRNVASDAIDDYRLDVVLDKAPAGVKATSALVYGSATPELGDPHNNLTRGRFKILRSMIGAFGESGNGIAHRVVNWRIPIKRIVVSKTANSFVQDAIMTNAVYVFYWTTSANNQPTIKCQGQVYSLDT